MLWVSAQAPDPLDCARGLIRTNAEHHPLGALLISAQEKRGKARRRVQSHRGDVHHPPIMISISVSGSILPERTRLAISAVRLFPSTIWRRDPGKFMSSPGAY